MRRRRVLPFALAFVAIAFTALNLRVGRLAEPQRQPQQQHRDVPSADAPRPPLESIVEGKWNITGDASWLLDFSIIGFPVRKVEEA